MSDSPDDILRESEQRRAHVAQLIDELRDHVTPAEIVNQVIGVDGGQEIARYLGRELRRQVRANPIPVGVIGVGVAWLLLADALRRHREIPLHDGLDYDYDVYDEHIGHSGRLIAGARRIIRHLSEGAARAREFNASAQEIEMADTGSDNGGQGSSGRNGAILDDDVQVGEPALQGRGNDGGAQSGFVNRTLQKGHDAATGLAQAALHKSGEALGDAKEAVSQTASSLMERTNEMATRTKRAVGRQASQAGSGIGQLAREQPLMVAGVGFALGVALGLLIPLSRAEREVLGDQAEKLKDKASELASEGYERAKGVAQRAYDAASDTIKSEAENQGLTGGQSGQSGSGSDNGGDTSSATYRH
jgi:ElaB/YqjD/DUF883 family membrane-anchored ribosome-binding protein